MATGIMRRRSAGKERGFRKTMKVNTMKDNSIVNTSAVDSNKKPSKKSSFAFLKIWSRNTHAPPQILPDPVIDEKKNEVPATPIEPVTTDIILPSSPCDVPLPESPVEEKVLEDVSIASKEQSPESVVAKESGDNNTPISDLTQTEVVDEPQTLEGAKDSPSTEAKASDEPVISPEVVSLPTVEDDLEKVSESKPTEDSTSNSSVDSVPVPTRQPPIIPHENEESLATLTEAAPKAEEVKDTAAAPAKKPLAIDTQKSRRNSPPRAVLSPKASSFTNSIPKSPTEKPSRRNSLFGRFGSMRSKRASKRMTVMPSMKEAHLYMQSIEDEDAKRRAKARASTMPVFVAPPSPTSPISPASTRPKHELGLPAKQTEISGSGFGQDVYF